MSAGERGPLGGLTDVGGSSFRGRRGYRESGPGALGGAVRAAASGHDAAGTKRYTDGLRPL